MTDTQVEIRFLKGTSNTVLIPALDEVMYRNMCEIPNPVEHAQDLAFAHEIVKTQNPADRLPDRAFDLRVMPYSKAGNVPIPGSSDTGDVSWVCPVSQCAASSWPEGKAAH